MRERGHHPCGQTTFEPGGASREFNGKIAQRGPMPGALRKQQGFHAGGVFAAIRSRQNVLFDVRFKYKK